MGSHGTSHAVRFYWSPRQLTASNGIPWISMGHRVSEFPMGPHGIPGGIPLRPHGNQWESYGIPWEVPWEPSQHTVRTCLVGRTDRYHTLALYLQSSRRCFYSICSTLLLRTIQYLSCASSEVDSCAVFSCFCPDLSVKQDMINILCN